MDNENQNPNGNSVNPNSVYGVEGQNPEMAMDQQKFNQQPPIPNPQYQQNQGMPNQNYMPPQSGQNPGYYTAPPQAIDTSPMSVGKWLVTLLILTIPIVGFIMVFVWAFGSGNVNRKNYFIAVLIYALIIIALWIVLFIIFGSALFSLFSGYGYYF